MSYKDRSGLRGIRGPIMVITVGVLFALNNFTPWHFEETWPVLIIVAGLLSLLGRAIAPSQPMPPPPQPFSTYQVPQQPPPPAGGGYRQTPYSQTNDPRNDPRNNPGNPGNPGGPA